MSEENKTKLEETPIETLKEILSDAIINLGQMKYFHANVEKDMEVVANDIRVINAELVRRDEVEKAAATKE